MPVSLNSQVAGEQETLNQLKKQVSSMLRVALPGTVESFDAETVTATIQLGILGLSDGESKALSVLNDVPVMFPRGGGCSLTFPVNKGDECLVIFADRCIDFWWQSGGVQEPVDERMHDLSDAFCIVGPQSQAKKIGGISTSAVELRSDDGETKLSLNPVSGAINGTAPGGFNLNGLKILSDGRLQLVDGSIVDKHTHGGVEPGGSSTAPLGG
ncbi:TPA: Gp138 family membrane-puncturing spike protein [Klebsiella pneumoniae]